MKFGVQRKDGRGFFIEVSISELEALGAPFTNTFQNAAMNLTQFAQIYKTLKTYADQQATKYSGWRRLYRKMPMPLILLRAILAGIDEGVQAILKEHAQ